ncbi:MAG TPA: TerB family tellurite resistance protein [Caulobacterales bacterium]|nr:TerB family tellurite resistance protein [Caulobacterales bacterium]
MSAPTPEHRAFVEAGIGVCMAVMMADGKLTAEELAWWQAAQYRHPLFKDVPASAFNNMLARVKEKLANLGAKAAINAWAPAVPQQYRHSIYELAVELAVVDHQLAGREPEIVLHIGACLGVPTEEARRIFMDRIEKM